MKAKNRLDPPVNAEHMAFCGFDCARCPMYEATVNDDAELKRALIERYSTGEKRLTEKDIFCLGCRAEKRYLHPYCEECDIRRCAGEHGVSVNCGECAEYPCKMIASRIPEDGESRKNMDAIRDLLKKTVAMGESI